MVICNRIRKLSPMHEKTIQEVADAIRGHVLAGDETIGIYSRLGG
jgi:hypothetical protein